MEGSGAWIWVGVVVFVVVVAVWAARRVRPPAGPGDAVGPGARGSSSRGSETTLPLRPPRSPVADSLPPILKASAQGFRVKASDGSAFVVRAQDVNLASTIATRRLEMEKPGVYVVSLEAVQDRPRR
ncbi:MAG: hypothetical protein JXB39_15565 [Deltaproteobacteria bacterium]|nr:hypothetical protein [Deltaproteobacteria bacterium]